ncbi:peptidoglycan bridge formation glycyltransferase FemA/FemB family protein, partial [Candidatus Berkelbacteria bacterium]|nr:peptidoglycan bridge formation glycyltransferase FemA/FemB family protein [Candidatus Berkelbacteria bacterium]
MKSLLQTETWAKFKEKSGWQIHKIGGALALERVLAAGKSMLYLPEVEYSTDLIKEILKTNAPSNRVFTRVEFLERSDPKKTAYLMSKGFKKSFEEIQPEYRIWLDLTKNIEEISAQMDKKGRYNVGLARRKNLQVVFGGLELIDRFFNLYQTTADRKKFAGRDIKYIRELAETLIGNKMGEIVIVYSDQEDLAASLITYYDGVASFLYSGTGGDRTLKAPYLRHFESYNRDKQKGCTRIDLLA